MVGDGNGTICLFSKNSKKTNGQVEHSEPQLPRYDQDAASVTGQSPSSHLEDLEPTREAIDSVIREMARAGTRAIMPFETDVRTSRVLHIEPNGSKIVGINGAVGED